MKKILCLLLMLVLLGTAFTSTVLFAEGDVILDDEDVKYDLNDAAFNGERYVTVGDKGTIMQSVDGHEWKEVYTDCIENLEGIAWGHGQFVAVGQSGAILASEDGITWKRQESNIESHLYSIIYAQEGFVAVGEDGTILSSPDAHSWKVRYKEPEKSFYDIAYNNSIYVATGNGIITWSHDLTTWKASIMPEEGPALPKAAGEASLSYNSIKFNGIAWNGTLFTAVGTYDTILTSNDGINWNKTITPMELQTDYNDVAWNGNAFVAVGSNGNMAQSKDAYKWDPIPPASPNIVYLNSIIWTGEVYLSVGSFSTILISPDLYDWIYPWTPLRLYHLNDVAWSPSLRMFVAVGTSGRIVTSPDGMSWTVRTSNTDRSLNGITWNSNNGVFVAVGDRGTVLASTNGINWTAYPSSILNDLMNIAWNGGNYVVVGTMGCIYMSYNASGWYSIPTFAAVNDTLNDVIYNGTNTIKAVGTYGKIGRTPDSINWYRDSNSSSRWLNDVIYSSQQGKYIAVGEYPGAIVTSSSTSNSWSTVALPSYIIQALNGITWKYISNPREEYYVVVGSNGTVLTSPNATSWSLITSSTTNNLNDITWSPNVNLFVAVGEYERIITSPNGINWTNRR